MKPYNPDADNNENWEKDPDDPTGNGQPSSDGEECGCPCHDNDNPMAFRVIWSFEILTILLEENPPSPTDIESEEELITQSIRITDNLLRKLMDEEA